MISLWNAIGCHGDVSPAMQSAAKNGLKRHRKQSCYRASYLYYFPLK